ncbi:MAG: hypothetical protein ACO3JL_17550 [Myxococcota bacterium]
MNDKGSAERLQHLIEALRQAGAQDLAETLGKHVDGRTRGEDTHTLASLWLS